MDSLFQAVPVLCNVTNTGALFNFDLTQLLLHKAFTVGSHLYGVTAESAAAAFPSWVEE